MRLLTQTLARWLEEGGEEAGEILIRSASGGFVLCHRADRDQPQLAETARSASRARARKLRRAGRLPSAQDRAQSPTGLAALSGDHRGAPYRARLFLSRDARHLAQRFGRHADACAAARDLGQTERHVCRDSQDHGCAGGRADRRVLPDRRRLSQAHPLAARAGRSDYLAAEREIRPFAAPGEMPLLCHEACNLLVARAREVVKKGEYIT